MDTLKEFAGYLLTAFFTALVILFPHLDVDEGPPARAKKRRWRPALWRRGTPER